MNTPEDFGIIKYTWKDGLLNCHQDVSLSFRLLKGNLPFNFGKIDGSFDCSNNSLTSLSGSPQEVNGFFLCSNNNLESLKGGPKIVRGSFFCGFNKLTSLVGSPQEIDGSFSCHNNRLISLDGCPEIIGVGFYCKNNNLASLKGCPRVVRDEFDVRNNQIISLEFLPLEIGGYIKIDGNKMDLSISQILELTIKYPNFHYNNVDIVDSPDQGTTIKNLMLKISIVNHVLSQNEK